MPHIPRAMAQTFESLPDLEDTLPKQPKAAKRPEVPVSKAEKKESERTTMIPRMSMRDFRMEPSRVFENLFGDKLKAEVNDITRELVPKKA